MKSYKSLKKIESNISPFLPVFFGCNRFFLSGNTFYLIDTFSLKRSIILKQRRNVENQIDLSLIKVEFFCTLIILTIYPHRIPTPGVSDRLRTTSTEHLAHTYAHTYAHRYTHTPAHTQTNIYHAQNKKIHIYAAHTR